jgi:hypothetical protein
MLSLEAAQRFVSVTRGGQLSILTDATYQSQITALDMDFAQAITKNVT